MNVGTSAGLIIPANIMKYEGLNIDDRIIVYIKRDTKKEDENEKKGEINGQANTEEERIL